MNIIKQQKMEPQKKITKEERRRLDRQRFIGLQTQKRLLSSQVLITPMNGINTELAKNLVLAGVNVTLYDDNIVTQQDYETNFLISMDEIGENRGEVIFKKLKEMNPSGHNQFYKQTIPLEKAQFFTPFTIICTSFLDFEQVRKMDNLTKEINKPYYNLLCAGLYGLAYISLGKQYKYKQAKNKLKKVQNKYEIKCLTFDECLHADTIVHGKGQEYDCLVGLLAMQSAGKKGLRYDPFLKEQFNDDMLKCMIQLGADFKEDVDEEFLKNFCRLFGVEYCPVYSVVGSVISQEIIKVVENQQEPGMNWFIFNSEQGYGKIVKLKKQKEQIVSEPCVMLQNL